MKSSLHFEAPGDLSVGTVSIRGGGTTVTEWIATPDNRTFRGDDLAPGLYSAEITPAWVAPQSVLFEIHEGQANTVVLPSFSALASSGTNTSFFDAQSQKTFSEIPYATGMHILEKLNARQVEALDFAPPVASSSESSRQIEVSEKTRHISVGLSQEVPGRRGFAPFGGQSKMAQRSGRVEIEVHAAQDGSYWSGQRVRLSAALEKVHILQCYLPIYRGGTRIVIAAPPFAASDLELEILPVDPKLRALVRALDAGTPSEAAAVRDHVLGMSDSSAPAADNADPWAAILTGLLAIRYPDVFQLMDQAWVDSLAQKADWAFDAHVIQANRALSNARGDTSSEARHSAVADAVACLARASAKGSPYYRYSNQLFGEMVAGIGSYLNNESGIRPTIIEEFDRITARWHRELPLQRCAGPTVTWLLHDVTASKERGLLVPQRNSSGTLRGKDTAIIFEGKLDPGRITIISAGHTGAESSSEQNRARDDGIGELPEGGEEELRQMPALSRPEGPDDDPNKGRYGGQSSRGGFRLVAAFEPTRHRDWATIILTLEVERSAGVGLGDYAWFVLHPTFSPTAMKVSFRGHHAQLRLQAWGGFTVGVWLPKFGVELECDLATLPDAPKIIRLR